MLWLYCWVIAFNCYSSHWGGIILASRTDCNLLTLSACLAVTQIYMFVEGVRYTAPGEQGIRCSLRLAFPEGKLMLLPRVWPPYVHIISLTPASLQKNKKKVKIPPRPDVADLFLPFYGLPIKRKASDIFKGFCKSCNFSLQQYSKTFK